MKCKSFVCSFVIREQNLQHSYMVTLIVLLEVPRKEWLVKMVNTCTTKAVSVKSKKGGQRSIFLPKRLRTTKQIKQHKYRLIELHVIQAGSYQQQIISCFVSFSDGNQNLTCYHHLLYLSACQIYVFHNNALKVMGH